MRHKSDTLGTLSLTALLSIAVTAARKEEAAHVSTPVKAGVSTPSLPSPSHSTLSSTRGGGLNLSSIVHLTTRRALVWGMTPPRSAPEKANRLLDELSRAGVALVPWMQKGGGASRQYIPSIAGQYVSRRSSGTPRSWQAQAFRSHWERDPVCAGISLSLL